MEDNEIFENEENIEEESEGSGSADPEESSISREEIIDLMREIVEENQTEEESSEVVEEESSEEESSEVDYSEILESILSELEEQSLARSQEIESQNVPITEKSLSDFTVTESLLCIVVCVFLVKGLLKLIEKFSPHI